MSTRTRERSAPAGRPSAVRSNAPDTPQGSSHRTPIEARIAERATIERALEARLTGSELRVLLALMVKVTKFDRLEDRVANIELVRLTGIASRHVREAVAGLAEKGVIEREPGGGRSASLYRFPSGPGRISSGDGSGPPDAQEAPTPDADAPPTPDAQEATSEGPSPKDPSEGHGSPLTESVTPDEPTDLAARRLVRREPFEVDGVIHDAEAKYGTDAVAHLIARYKAEGVRESFASSLRRRIDRDLAGVGSPTPQRLATRTPCAHCGGTSGYVLDDANIARPCPACNASTMAVTA